jgi:hypothetical protein
MASAGAMLLFVAVCGTDAVAFAAVMAGTVEREASVAPGALAAAF